MRRVISGVGGETTGFALVVRRGGVVGRSMIAEVWVVVEEVEVVSLMWLRQG